MELEQNSHEAVNLSATLEDLRLRLLDTSKRNPLINTRFKSRGRKQIIVIDELADQIFRILYGEQRKFTFLPQKVTEDVSADESTDEESIYVPSALEQEVHERHTDTKLQTDLTPEELQRRLLALYRESRALEEDLSINVLYLAIGFMTYFDADSSDVERNAPLILLPVTLARDSSKSLFNLTIRDEDLSTNQSLAQMLYEEHQLILPELTSSQDFIPSTYFRAVEEVVASKSRWNVIGNRMMLRFFSFERFMMAHDLDVSAIEKFATVGDESINLTNQLFGVQTQSGSANESRVSVIEEATDLDSRYADLKELNHVLDADTSQTQVIDAALKGTNLVVQGPPGTGKSQTIANIVAAALAQSKTVLFVAEKRAALDVVFKRLQQCGLGHLCLELHSHKANRKHFYEDLKETLDAVPIRPIDTTLFDEIQQTRDRLNRISTLIHKVDEVTSETPYTVMGKMAEFHGKRIPAPTFATIDDIGIWSKDEFKVRLNILGSFAALVNAHGVLHEHVWYGVEKRLTPADRSRLQTYLARHDDLSRHLFDALHVVQSVDGAYVVNNLDKILRCLEKQRLLLNRPARTSEFLQKKEVVQHSTELLELFDVLKSCQAIEVKLQDKFLDVALERDWSIAAQAIEMHGKSLFRFINSGYRRAISSFKQVLKIKLPASYEDRVEMLSELMTFQTLQKSIDARDELGRAHFGLTWSKYRTNVDESLSIVRWIADNVSHFESHDLMLAEIDALGKINDITQCHVRIEECVSAWRENIDHIIEILGLNIALAFGSENLVSVEFDNLSSKFAAWLANTASLDEYFQLKVAAEELRNLGLHTAVDAVDQKQLRHDLLVDSVVLLRCEAIFNRLKEAVPELGEINGDERSDLVAKFKRQDRQLKVLAAQEIVVKHHQNMPRGTSGQMGLIRGEASKKTRHMPIRQLLDNAGEAIAIVKPVFLMSPLSISRFLSPGGLSFDLLLIDEASQIKPEQAIGAMMRAKQVVVVGDQKQMPPTSFFEKSVAADDLEEETDAGLDDLIRGQTADMESVLSLCEARGLNNAMLRWHYRSEHPSLIEVSNKEFYNDKLIYPPPPNLHSEDAGLRLVEVDGVYARSRARNNPVEADTVCEHVLKHVNQHPDQSLGVVALATPQRDMIQHKLDRLCSEQPALDHFCHTSGEEPFFVKNLENVQGDERDVIFISIGYGRDESGKFFQNLGPVSTEGGERRLNVLFTRSRKKCVIFSSIGHEEVRTDTAKSQGPRILKQFLKYAKTGELDIPLVTGKEEDSPFERDVAQVLEQHGYQVERQVGSAGFSIDLAVRDPADTSHFLIAIECDGARYHSSSWARERDRLRQEVLEGKGWLFHRIWSTDWFYARDRQITKMLDAINAAQVQSRTPPISKEVDSSDSQSFIVAGDELDDPSAMPKQSAITTEPYTEADFKIHHSETVQDSLTPEAIESDLLKIVSIESPIHQELAVIRLARLWNKRCTANFKEAVIAAIDRLVAQLRLSRSEFEPDFLVDQATTSVSAIRDRKHVDLRELKNPAYIPRIELEAAVEAIVNESVSIDLASCRKEIAKLLGTNTRREDMLTAIRQAVQRLADQGRLLYDGDMVSRAN